MGKLAFLLGVPVALLATVASLGVVVVDVREGGPKGQRIVVPVPLIAAQAALAVAPAVAKNQLRIPDREAIEHVAVARGVMEALAQSPDGELVRVEEPDQQVVITKRGRSLQVRVQGRRGENVSVNVPMHLALSALPDAQGRIHTGMLAAALGTVRFTDLVDVQNGNDHVRIYVW